MAEKYDSKLSSNTHFGHSTNPSYFQQASLLFRAAFFSSVLFVSLLILFTFKATNLYDYLVSLYSFSFGRSCMFLLCNGIVGILVKGSCSSSSILSASDQSMSYIKKDTYDSVEQEHKVAISSHHEPAMVHAEECQKVTVESPLSPAGTETDQRQGCPAANDDQVEEYDNRDEDDENDQEEEEDELSAKEFNMKCEEFIRMMWSEIKSSDL